MAIKYSPIQGFATDASGSVIAGAKVEVTTHEPGNPLATVIFEDRNGAVAADNPIITDADGYYLAYVPGGAYRLRIYTGTSEAPTYERIMPHVQIGTAKEYDASNLLFAYIIHFDVENTPPSAYAPPGHVVPFACTAPEGMANSLLYCRTDPASAVEFDVYVDGVAFATCTIAAGANDGVVDSDAETEIPAGAVVTIVLPSPADADMANVSLTLVLPRS